MKGHSCTTLYKTTNLINNKFYIGSHRTKNIDDNYMGSGKLLKRAIEKYGIENFKKEILFVFNNPEDMYAKEKELVDEDFLSENNTYNLKIGGYGGWDYANKPGNNKTHTKEFASYRNLIGKEKRELAFKNKFKDLEWKKQFSNKISVIKKEYYKTHEPYFKGEKHSEKTKKHLSEVHKGKHIGKNNSQYGTCWITNGVENKKIKKEDIDNWINIGYYKGRKMINDAVTVRNKTVQYLQQV